MSRGRVMAAKAGRLVPARGTATQRNLISRATHGLRVSRHRLAAAHSPWAATPGFAATAATAPEELALSPEPRRDRRRARLTPPLRPGPREFGDPRSSHFRYAHAFGVSTCRTALALASAGSANSWSSPTAAAWQDFALRHRSTEPVDDIHGTGTQLTLTGLSPRSGWKRPCASGCSIAIPGFALVPGFLS